MRPVAQNKIADLLEILSNAKKITVVTHSRPDGDALGSSAALKIFASEVLGRDCEVAVPNEFGTYLSFTAAEGIIVGTAEPGKAERRIQESDAIVCIDLNSTSRCDQLGPAVEKSGAKKILIDHHLSPELEKFDLAFSETDVSSACELLYRILLGTPQIGGDAGKLPRACAEALFTGMTTDTNNFANSVFPGTLEMASGLLDAGVDREMILDKLYRSYRENRVRVFSYMLGEKMKITPEGVSYMILTSEEWEKFGLEQGETEGLVNEPLTIGKVRMSVFLKEDGGLFRVSVRSKRGISANAFAKSYFHGGGHEQASGGKLQWPEDIPVREKAAEYVERAAKEFMEK